MNTSLIVLAVIVAIAVLLSVLPTPKWVRVITAAILFTFQAFVLLVSFDASARAVLSERISAGKLTPDFELGVGALRSDLMSDRFALLLASAGLFILVIAKPSSKKEEAKASC